MYALSAPNTTHDPQSLFNLPSASSIPISNTAFSVPLFSASNILGHRCQTSLPLPFSRTNSTIATSLIFDSSIVAEHLMEGMSLSNDMTDMHSDISDGHTVCSPQSSPDTRPSAARIHFKRRASAGDIVESSPDGYIGVTGRSNRPPGKASRSTVLTGRRRRTSELNRGFACSEDGCGRRYEAWRSLQHHLKADHGRPVRLKEYRAISVAGCSSTGEAPSTQAAASSASSPARLGGFAAPRAHHEVADGVHEHKATTTIVTSSATRQVAETHNKVQTTTAAAVMHNTSTTRPTSHTRPIMSSTSSPTLSQVHTPTSKSFASPPGELLEHDPASKTEEVTGTTTTTTNNSNTPLLVLAQQQQGCIPTRAPLPPGPCTAIPLAGPMFVYSASHWAAVVAARQLHQQFHPASTTSLPMAIPGVYSNWHNATTTVNASPAMLTASRQQQQLEQPPPQGALAGTSRNVILDDCHHSFNAASFPTTDQLHHSMLDNASVDLMMHSTCSLTDDELQVTLDSMLLGSVWPDISSDRLGSFFLGNIGHHSV